MLSPSVCARAKIGHVHAFNLGYGSLRIRGCKSYSPLLFLYFGQHFEEAWKNLHDARHYRRENTSIKILHYKVLVPKTV